MEIEKCFCSNVRLFHVTGKVIAMEKLFLKANDHEWIMDMHNLKPGIYFLKMDEGDQSHTFPIHLF